jgi:hypothetical protein
MMTAKQYHEEKKGRLCRALEKAAKIAGLDLRFNQAASTESIYVSSSDADLSVRISDHTKKMWSCGEQVVRVLDVADEIESAADEIVTAFSELPEYRAEQLESFKSAWYTIAQSIRNRRDAARKAAKKAQNTREEKRQQALEIAREILRSEKSAKLRNKSGRLADNRHLAFYHLLAWHMPKGLRVSKADARNLYYQEWSREEQNLKK